MAMQDKDRINVGNIKAVTEEIKDWFINLYPIKVVKDTSLTITSHKNWDTANIFLDDDSVVIKGDEVTVGYVGVNDDKTIVDTIEVTDSKIKIESDTYNEIGANGGAIKEDDTSLLIEGKDQVRLGNNTFGIAFHDGDIITGTDSAGLYLGAGNLHGSNQISIDGNICWGDYWNKSSSVASITSGTATTLFKSTDISDYDNKGTYVISATFAVKNTNEKDKISLSLRNINEVTQVLSSRELTFNRDVETQKWLRIHLTGIVSPNVESLGGTSDWSLVGSYTGSGTKDCSMNLRVIRIA